MEEKAVQTPPQKPKQKFSMPMWLQLTFVAGAMTFFALVVSIIMQIVVNEREDIDYTMDESTYYNYGGEFIQNAPTLNALDFESSFGSRLMSEQNLSKDKFYTLVQRYVENTNLISTNGSVLVNIDLQKRGLRFEPTFRTEFEAEYILANKSAEDSYIEFEFPFPQNVLNKEITNASLVVDGVTIDNPIKQIKIVNAPVQDCYYGDCGQPETSNKSSLYWEGKVKANSETTVVVKYHTVGLSNIVYEGLENPNGSQDFNFVVKVVGSRKYDNQGSLSIDEREYINEDGRNGIILTWDKPELFSTPEVNVAVATLTNPARHLYEMYKIMVPLYIFFSAALIIMASVLKRKMNPVDLLLLSVLFIVFFPLLHYLVSFNVDPSADFLSNVKNDVNFSMPLYGAFILSFVLVGGLMINLMRKMTDGKFTFGIVLPLLLMSMGFFPLAMTLPEYKYLLVLIGIVFVLGIAVQIRVRKANMQS